MQQENILELVVTDGDQAGARSFVKLGQTIEVSDSIDSDIVLSDPSVAGKKIRLVINNDNAQLDVVTGEVDIMGKRFMEGQTALLSAYQVASIGNSGLAYGEVDSHQWQQLLSTDEPIDRQQWLDEDEIRQPKEPIENHKNWITLLACGLGVFIACYFVYGQFYKIDHSLSLEKIVNSLDLKIKESGYAALSVGQQNGLFSISGYLPTLQRHAELEQLLATFDVPLSINVQIGERLAMQVKDVYRVNGINAEVNVEQQGVARVKTTEEDTAHLEKIKTVALKDIANLKKIITNNKPPVIEEDEGAIASDPNKRISMIVNGDIPYIVTVDRSRYYIGALLPSGHKVTEITDMTVTLTKGDAVTLLNF